MEFQVFTVDAPRGFEVEAYLGVVAAPVFEGVNIVRDWFASWRDVMGGRSRAYEKSIRDAQGRAGDDLIRLACERGANAVVGLRLRTQVVQQPRGGGMVLVTAEGTAVRLRPVPSDERPGELPELGAPDPDGFPEAPM